MADKKISALTAATTPLAGTEVLPIVQGGATVKATVANIVGAGTSPGSFTSVNASADIVLANTKSLHSDAISSYIVVAGGSTSSQSQGSGVYFYGNTNAGTGSIYMFSGNVAGADIVIAPRDTEKVRISTTGNVTLSTGNLIIGTSGAGIDFSATPGTGTSELLADYEEGTFTPTVAGVTLTLAAGRYTKIGRTVFVEIFCRFPVTADTTTTQIGDLPFTPVTGGNTYLGNVGVQSSLATHVRNLVFATGIQPQTSANASFTNVSFSSADVYIAGTYTA